MTQLTAAIDRFLALKAPSDQEREEVRRYRQRLYGILSAEFKAIQFFQSGSFEHGTAITPYSDVDYFVWLPYDQQTQVSTSILNKIKSVFARDLWEATSISVDRPTVKIKFPGLVTSYEIVPAFYGRGEKDNMVFSIPGPGGAWRESAPRAHLALVRKINDERHGAVKATARLLKAWKYKNNLPVSSFYLEMRAAEYGKANTDMYPIIAMRSITNTLVSSGLPMMNDPAGLVGRISPCSSDSNRMKVLAALRTLSVDLQEAIAAFMADDTVKLTLAMRKVFGDDFPYVQP